MAEQPSGATEAEPLSIRDQALQLQQLLQDFEELLLLQVDDARLDLEELGWTEKLRRMYQYADNVYKRMGMKVFEEITYWVGNIEKSYSQNYSVAIGRPYLTGERGLRKRLADDIERRWPSEYRGS